MTKEELQEILSKPIPEIVKAIEAVELDVPDWASELYKQYDPMEHAIIKDLVRYPPKLDTNGNDEFKRTPLGLQKLAVRRISQSMFATPTERTFSYDKDDTKQEEAAAYFEEVYGVKNTIDASNIERAKQLNASCQIATVWWVRELSEPELVNGFPTKYKLSHKSYSPMKGYSLYPHYDEYGDLIALGIGYTTPSNQNVMDLYTTNFYVRYIKLEEWQEAEGTRQALEFLPVVYMEMDEPVWGGAEGTALVEQLEEMESYQGLYIKSNSLPTFTLDLGEITGGTGSTASESSNDRRRVLKVGKGGKMSDVTWKGAGESVKSRYERLRNSFFEQIQMPDISFATMIASNTSAENKELVFADARQKAIDLGGEWLRFFMQEANIVKKFAAIMLPSHKEAFKAITILSNIQPYNVRSNKDMAEYIANAGQNMSLHTKVRLLNETNNVEQEVERIEEERSASFNQGFL